MDPKDEVTIREAQQQCSTIDGHEDEFGPDSGPLLARAFMAHVPKLLDVIRRLSAPAAPASPPVPVPDAEGLAKIAMQFVCKHNHPAYVVAEARTCAETIARACLAPIVEARRVHREACERVERFPKRELTDAEVRELDAAVREQTRTYEALLSLLDTLAGRT